MCSGRCPCSAGATGRHTTRYSRDQHKRADVAGSSTTGGQPENRPWEAIR